MSDAHAAAEKLSMTLYDLLADDFELSDLLDDLARLAAEHFRADHHVDCGIILRREKKNIVVATSSKTAAEMDEIQAGFGSGPCLEAMRSSSTIQVADVRTEERWPEYMEVIRERGLASALAIPLDLGGSGDAAMNFYTRETGLFASSDVAEAERYAELIAKALRIALRTTDHAEAARHRQRAMESRTTIDLAIGIVMAQNHCSQDEAFAILRGAASHRNIKLRELADQVVASLGHGSPSTFFDD